MTTVLNIKVAPRRMLTLREASEYVGVKEKRFPAECGIPAVSMPSGALLYDIKDLDVWIDSRKAGSNQSDDEILGRLG